MRIIVDGPQGSGKTTFCQRISESFGLSYCKHDSVRLMTREDYERDDVVHDRSFMSSVVYGYLWDCELVPKRSEVLRMIDSVDLVVILYSASDKLLIDRVNSRPHPEHPPLTPLEIDVLKESNALFKAFAELPGVVGIDVSKIDLFDETISSLILM